jgi:hypothetical protein
MSRVEDQRRRFAREALKALKHPLRQEPRAFVQKRQVVLMLWCYPWFEDWTSWALLRSGASADGSASKYAVRAVTWHRKHDLEALNGPLGQLAGQLNHVAPTISVSDATVSHTSIEPMVSRCDALTVMIGLDTSVTPLDGIQWGLQTFGNLGRLRAEWWSAGWSDGPPEWAAVASWAQDMRRLFRTALSTDPAPGP